MRVMGELVSDDVLEWARDLAAMRRLFAGEPVKRYAPGGSAKILNFRLSCAAKSESQSIDQRDARTQG